MFNAFRVFKSGREWQNLFSLKIILTVCFYLIFIGFLVTCPSNVCVVKLC